MRLLISFLIVAIAATSAVAQYQPQTINIVPGEVFIPPGFDNNDRAELVLEGFYPNSCYKTGFTTHRVDKASKKIYIDSQAMFYDQVMCLEVLVHYEKTVRLGVLPEGKYELMFNSDKGYKSFKEISISKASSKAPDSFLYAPVEQAVFYRDENKSPWLKLIGKYTSNCMEMKTVRVLQGRTDNVVEVLPIVKMRSDIACDDGLYPYEHDINISGRKDINTLFHVRSLNGRSVNRLVNMSVQ